AKQPQVFARNPQLEHVVHQSALLLQTPFLCWRPGLLDHQPGLADLFDPTPRRYLRSGLYLVVAALSELDPAWRTFRSSSPVTDVIRGAAGGHGEAGCHCRDQHDRCHGASVFWCVARYSGATLPSIRVISGCSDHVRDQQGIVCSVVNRIMCCIATPRYTAGQAIRRRITAPAGSTIVSLNTPLTAAVFLLSAHVIPDRRSRTSGDRSAAP